MSESPGYLPPPGEVTQYTPTASYRVSGRLRATIATVIAVVVIMAGVSMYTIAGVALASNRISTADRALKSAIAHHSELKTTFSTMTAQLQTLTAANFDPMTARRLMAELVTTSQSAGGTVDGDDAALAAAGNRLDEHQWLTVLSRSRLDHEANRIAHARKALKDARILTSDYVLVGQFFQAYVEAVIDYLTLIGSYRNQDYTGAGTANTAMQTHLAQALKLSGAPGVPTILHDFIVDFQVVAADLATLIDAVMKRDQAAYNAALTRVQADNKKLDAYDFDLAGAQLRAYYQPYTEEFDSEMDKATH